MLALFPDCNSAGIAIQTSALAITAAALAITAFALAYIARQLRSWRIWSKDN